MAHGSARASHNTGPLGVASQYRITNWGKMRDWAYRWFSLPHRNLRVFQPGINSKYLPCGGFWVEYQGHEDDPSLTQDGMGGGGWIITKLAYAKHPMIRTTGRQVLLWDLGRL